MFGFNESEVKKFHKCVEPSFYREYVIFFDEVRQRCSKNFPELEHHRLQVAFRVCKSLGKDYMKYKAMHEAFQAEVWQCWLEIDGSSKKFRNELFRIIVEQHTILRKRTMQWVTYWFYLLQELAKYCPWLQLYVFDLKFSLFNAEVTQGAGKMVNAQVVYDEIMGKLLCEDKQ